MRKVKITADAVLAIIQGIFGDEDVNLRLTDPSAHEVWQGKTVEEILNVEYYTFKHRPASTQKIVEAILESEGQTDRLAALNRAFCLCSLGTVERLYSKDVDMAVLNATLDYYIQTDKVKIVESLIENANIATSGLRIPVQFGDETRKAVIFFGRPNVGDIMPTTPFGEMATVEVGVTLMLYPNVISYSDYTVSVTFTDAAGKEQTAAVPLTSFSVPVTMTQTATPRINDPRNTGSINLSRARSFVLVFEGYDNPFINFITDRALGTEETDNNDSFTLTIERGEKTYTHTVVIKDHQIVVSADTGNETHTLTLTTRGV